MKKTRLIIALLAVAMVPMLPGCVKHLEMDSHEPGTEIVFGISNTCPTDEETRTEYSGKDQNNNNMGTSSTYERIDWVSDKDRILCDAASGKATPTLKTADYVVFNVSMNSSDKKRS